MGKETGEKAEVSRVVKETIQTPFQSPSLVKRFRAYIAKSLINLAYRISWDGYVDAICDGDFGYCPDCEQCCDPEWRCR